MPPKTLGLDSALGHLAADKRLEILRLVGERGSISQAARDASVSYKAAWQALDTLSNLAGAALVNRAVGGVGGGGARLTAAGLQLLEAADEMGRAREQVLARLAVRGGNASGVAALALRTSMRNQLPCVVQSVKRHGAVVQVQMKLPGDAFLCSRITHESFQLLGLEVGQPVLALCKAMAVSVATEAMPAPGRNLLHGRVSRASRSVAGGEVALALDAGLQLVGFAQPGSGLKVRQPAVAWIDESAVVVAVAG
ncbi:MAG: TOBE domain-containing protein [Ramlibacter sp.]